MGNLDVEEPKLAIALSPSLHASRTGLQARHIVEDPQPCPSLGCGPSASFSEAVFKPGIVTDGAARRLRESIYLRGCLDGLLGIDIDVRESLEPHGRAT